MVTMSFQSRYKTNGKEILLFFFSNVILIPTFNFVHYNLSNLTTVDIQPPKCLIRYGTMF